MVRETKLTVDDLIHPIFVVEGFEIKKGNIFIKRCIPLFSRHA